MIKRCVEISSGPTHLAVRYGQLVLKREGEEIARIPVEDLGVLIADHGATTYTQGALNSLLANNVSVVLCGEDHHPTGMFLPMEGNTFQAQAVVAQAEAPAALKKRLWKEIVQAKVRAQADLLEHLGEEAAGLRELARGVKTGDPENIEAQAAQRYWKQLFSPDFRRRRGGEPPNNLLNYGYMVLRAATARALVGAGLHPSLGLHHRNKYNAFALADDFMEPLRAVVDNLVYRLHESGEREISPEIKKALIGLTAGPVEMEGQRSPLLIAAQKAAASLRNVLMGKETALRIPSFLPEEPAP